MASTPIYPVTIQTAVAKILPADTTTFKTLVTAGANGCRIDNIIVSSTDTVARDLQFVVTISGTDYILTTISAIINSGNSNSIPNISVLNHAQWPALAIDANGNRVLFLGSGAVLRVKSAVTVSATREISLVAQVGQY